MVVHLTSLASQSQPDAAVYFIQDSPLLFLESCITCMITPSILPPTLGTSMRKGGQGCIISKTFEGPDMFLDDKGVSVKFNLLLNDQVQRSMTNSWVSEKPFC